MGEVNDLSLFSNPTHVYCIFFSWFVFIHSYVVMMPKKRQALVEYEDMNGSCNAVTYAGENQVYIAGHPAFINYSTSQKISRPGDSDDTRSVNNVLLLTIINPIYPITTVTGSWNKACVQWLLVCSIEHSYLVGLGYNGIYSPHYMWAIVFFLNTLIVNFFSTHQQ